MKRLLTAIIWAVVLPALFFAGIAVAHQSDMKKLEGVKACWSVAECK